MADPKAGIDSLQSEIVRLGNCPFDVGGEVGMADLGRVVIRVGSDE